MQAIVTKFLPATSYRPSRIVATSGSGLRLIVSSDAPTIDGRHRAAAEALCVKLKWPGRLIGGGLKNGYAWVFADSDL